MSAVKVSAKGWIVIPKELRQKYHLEPGTKVQVVDYGGVLSLVRVPDNPLDALDGMFKSQGGGSWTEELIEEHRREVERDRLRAP